MSGPPKAACRLDDWQALICWRGTRSAWLASPTAGWTRGRTCSGPGGRPWRSGSKGRPGYRSGGRSRSGSGSGSCGRGRSRGRSRCGPWCRPRGHSGRHAGSPRRPGRRTRRRPRSHSRGGPPWDWRTHSRPAECAGCAVSRRGPHGTWPRALEGSPRPLSVRQRVAWPRSARARPWDGSRPPPQAITGDTAPIASYHWRQAQLRSCPARTE